MPLMCSNILNYWKSLELIDQETSAQERPTLPSQAHTLLLVMLLLEPEGIPESVLIGNDEVRQLIPEYPCSQSDLHTATESLLRETSLGVTRDPERQTLSIHPKDQDDMRRDMTDLEFANSFGGAVALLASQWHRFESTPQPSDGVVAHVQKLVDNFKQRATPPILTIASRKTFSILLTLASA